MFIHLFSIAFSIIAAALLSMFDLNPHYSIPIVMSGFGSIIAAQIVTVIWSKDEIKRLALLVYLIGVAYWFVLPAIYDAVFSDYNYLAARIQATWYSLNKACVLILLFNACVVFFYWISTYRTLARGCVRVVSTTNQIPESRLRNIAILLGIVGVSWFIIQSGGLGSTISFITGSRSTQKPWSSAGNFGTTVTPFKYVMQAFIINSAVFLQQLALFSRVRLPTRVIYIGVALILVLFVSVDTGNRSLLLIMTIPSLSVYFVESKSISRKIMLVLPALVLVYVFASFQVQTRSGGGLSQVGNISVKYFSDNNFYRETAFAVEVSEREPLTYESHFFKILIGPIPRFLWENKPKLDTIYLYSFYVRGVDVEKRGGNSLPSVVGQYYMSWSYWGIFVVGLVWGVLLRISDEVIRKNIDRNTTITIALFAVYIFLSFRGVVYGWVIPLLFNIIIRKSYSGLFARREKQQ